LAYELHRPEAGDSAGTPIIFMHGLFGSKKNNRTMSRCVHCRSPAPTDRQDPGP
jgi:hypothetical protein